MSARAALLGLACLAAGACGETRLTEGLEEPFAVHDAQLLEGELPGAPPDQGTASPRPTASTTETTVLRPGLPGVAFFGWATLDAVAVAAKIEGQGSGYWVLPAGPPDPQVQGEPVRVWRFVADLHASLAPGRHRLLVSALDAAGRAGNQVATSLCIHRRVPDNGNACDATKAPPEIAISLEWDRPVDLDLVVVTPSGEAISARSPAKGLGAEEKINRSSPDKNPPGSGYLDVDSNNGCRIDARQLENVVFQERPPPGSYLVYASLFDACGQPSARYTVTRWTRGVVDPAAGTFEVAVAERWSGTAVAIQASGGARLGTFVGEFFVP